MPNWLVQSIIWFVSLPGCFTQWIGEQYELQSRPGDHDRRWAQSAVGWRRMSQWILPRLAFHEGSQVITRFDVIHFVPNLSSRSLLSKRICGRIGTVPPFQWHVDDRQPENVTISLKHIGLNDGKSEGLSFTLTGDLPIFWYYSQCDLQFPWCYNWAQANAFPTRWTWPLTDPRWIPPATGSWEIQTITACPSWSSPQKNPTAKFQWPITSRVGWERIPRFH